MTTDTACSTVRAEHALSRIHRLEFDVPWPPKRVAAYLLEGPEPILIDAGAPGAAGQSELLEGLAEIDFEPADIDHVLVTHAHIDHIGQLPALREAGATVHVPKTAVSRLERDLETARDGFREAATAAGYDGDALAEIVDEQGESLRRNRRLVDPETVCPVDSGAPFTVGEREFEPFETPGHEIDHRCFETTVADATVLFSGDALIEPFRAGAFQVGLDHGADDAVDAYYDAMDRLTATTATHVFPGHGPTFEDPQRTVETTRDRLDALLEGTRGAVDVIEPATPLEIAEQRTGDVRHMAPVLDTIGALGTLEGRGSVSSETEDGVRYYETT
ncbi:MBL fold metallo-hydrolase [Natrinema zhouii]|uniref:MBL fold metallo-hydrolase n=1 Tax=Natrinema zhouii TaxID=1710539 RepID=A0A7D6CQB3_9EURY|nr:MBL fold metallo-hydrolase [Natrinema zhouii]QLK25473.1 MBL fold metallo-hydrolase [Natrinema zhouii]